MAQISLLTDPGLTDNAIYVVTPTPKAYRLLGPYGGLNRPNSRWALLTDGLGRMRYYISRIRPRESGWALRDLPGDVKVRSYVRNGAQVYEFELDTRSKKFYEGCGEFDLLLLAVTPLDDVFIAEPGLIPMEQQPSLADMKSLTMRYTEAVWGRKYVARCQPGYDCSLMMCSAYVKCETTDQVLQYEVITGDSRDMVFNASVFADTGDFIGIADSSTLYGVPYLTDQASAIGPRTVTFDLLPRLRSFINPEQAQSLVQYQPSYKMPGVRYFAKLPTIKDPDLSKWKVLMASWGPFTNGAAVVQYQLSDIHLEAEVDNEQPTVA